MYEVFTYNPAEVQLTVASYVAEGWDEITIKRAPSFIFKKGINGKHTRIQDYDTSALVTISVIKTSQANDIFSQIHEEDIINGTGRLELTLKDYSGESVFNSIEAYIVGYPEISYRDALDFNTWTIVCQSTDDYYVGGNARPNEQFIIETLKRLVGG